MSIFKGESMPPLVQDATQNDLTYRIIGAAMAVHNAIGPGYKEEVYEQALAVELNQREIAHQRQYPVPVTHDEEQVALFYLDLFVDEQVVVEIKAFSHQLTNDERAQVINYLKATEAPVGLLFNFGRRRLEYKRIFPGKATGETIQRVGRDDIRKRGRAQ
jgi:GxxExxY protein